jgi:hypothetical protein
MKIISLPSEEAALAVESALSDTSLSAFRIVFFRGFSVGYRMTVRC